MSKTSHVNSMKHLLKVMPVITLTGWVVLVEGCGSFGSSTSTAGSFNDPVPSGTVVAQGSFSGRNGQTVTGTALVYLTTAGNYVLRLQSLAAPSEAALQLYATVNGVNTQLTSLKGPTGNQDY